MKKLAARTQSRWRRQILRVALLLAVVTAALAHAQAPAPQSFEVASVKRGRTGDGYTALSPWDSPRFSATNVSLEFLLQLAYDVDDDLITGKPDWLGSELYSVEAKPEGEANLSLDQLRPLLRQLLLDRFHLAVHREKKEIPGYALLVGKGGPKLQAAPASAGPNYILLGSIRTTGAPLTTFTKMLASPLGEPTIDRTGITGNYTIRLDYAQEGDPNSTLPSIFTAVQEQLGLKLERQKIPVELLVIDHVDKEPVAN
jgi:uncharacterized protein (TIGR03435 family)